MELVTAAMSVLSSEIIPVIDAMQSVYREIESLPDAMSAWSCEMVYCCSEMDIISSEIRVLVPEMNVLLFFNSLFGSLLNI